CLRRLSEAQARAQRLSTFEERLDIVREATREVIRPSTFGVIIILVVYLPVFTLTGIEGKMFHPMAITVVLALSAALVLSVTFVPAAVALFVRGAVAEHENRIMSSIRGRYEPLLLAAIRRRWLIV